MKRLPSSIVNYISVPVRIFFYIQQKTAKTALKKTKKQT